MLLQVAVFERAVLAALGEELVRLRLQLLRVRGVLTDEGCLEETVVTSSVGDG